MKKIILAAMNAFVFMTADSLIASEKNSSKRIGLCVWQPSGNTRTIVSRTAIKKDVLANLTSEDIDHTADIQTKQASLEVELMKKLGLFKVFPQPTVLRNSSKSSSTSTRNANSPDRNVNSPDEFSLPRKAYEDVATYLMNLAIHNDNDSNC